MERKRRVILILCLIFGIWHLGTQWTSTLLSFLQWDTKEVMTIKDLSYIQSFGSLCNAIGALAFGQLADTTGPKTMFLMSAVITSLYYSGLSLCRDWYSFFFLQILRIGYQLDGTAEMYLATVTTESERTRALLQLTVPQAIALFFGPMIGARVAVYVDLRISQFLAGVFTLVALTPVIIFLLPQTHSVPRLASARLRPQDYLPMVMRNRPLREGLTLRALLVASYICFELIARNFLLKNYMEGPNDSAIVLFVMGASLLLIQLLILPFLQKRHSPRSLLQIALVSLVICYSTVTFVTNFHQILIITAVQTGAYAIAYAESCTQITSSVESTDLGKATGLAAMAQWMVHFVVPIYTSHLVSSWHYTYAFYTSALLSVFTLLYITFIAQHANARLRSLLPSLTIT